MAQDNIIVMDETKSQDFEADDAMFSHITTFEADYRQYSMVTTYMLYLSEFQLLL